MRWVVPSLLASLLVAGGCGGDDASPDAAIDARPEAGAGDAADGAAPPGDRDRDGVPDEADVCPDVADPAQLDGDGDAAGDACDPDRDGDGLANDADPWPDDRCCTADADGDGRCDGRDPDRDGDGYDDLLERRLGHSDRDRADHPAGEAAAFRPCADPLPGADLDGDGAPNAADPDDDGDGVADAAECAAAPASDPYDPRVVPGARARVPDRCHFGPTGGAGWLAGETHIHSNYSPIARDRGGDDLGRLIRIAEWYGDPRMVARHPEYAGRGLDFLAVTDHNTAEAALDPAFRSNRLLLIQGEEFRLGGHANLWGLAATVTGEPAAAAEPATVAAAIARVHAQGGLVGVNHPSAADAPWLWAASGWDAVEAWNLPWAAPMTVLTPADIAAHAARHPVDPAARLAIAWGGEPQEMDRRFWEAVLTSGRAVAAIGAGDRQAVLMPALPTTWVHAAERTVEAILAAVRARHTTVSRSPVAPRAELRVRAGSRALEAGDVAERAAFAVATVEVRVLGAPGGRVELVEGDWLAGAAEEVLLGTPPPRIVADLPLAAADATVTWEWRPAAPAWLYARVLEPLDVAALDPPVRAAVEALFARIEAGVALESFFAPLLDLQWLLAPRPGGCQPERTPPGRFECVPVDDVPTGTFFVPEPLGRALNVVTAAGRVTPWAMAAMTSAVVLR